MAELCPNSSWPIGSRPSAPPGKELIFVKMTDSACRAIEEYSRNRGALSDKATIRFTDNGGCLSFPTSVKSGAATAARKFNFSITECEDPRRAPQLIKQPTQGAEQRLETWGPISNKMQIQANDDSYETTKIRMAVAKESQKKKCLLEIEPNQTNIGRKTKVNVKVSRIKQQVPSTTSSLSSAPTSAAVDRRISCTDVAAKSSCPDITRRSIQDRLIHLLAVRLYEKPELYVKLSGQGLTKQEKGQIGIILDAITYVRDGKYHLKRHIWKDVQEDWPFYTEQDRESMKRRRPETVSSSPSSGGPPKSSPPEGSNSSCKSSASAYELKGDEHLAEQSCRRQRISHVAKRSTATNQPIVKPSDHGSEDNTSDMSEMPAVEYDFSELPTIRSIQQCNEYKIIFKWDYEAYLRQRDELLKRTGLFRQFEKKRKQHFDFDDESVIQIRRQIETEQKKRQCDLEYMRVMWRLDYLHSKLAHIRRLVNAFEQADSRIEKSSTESNHPNKKHCNHNSEDSSRIMSRKSTVVVDTAAVQSDTHSENSDDSNSDGDGVRRKNKNDSNPIRYDHQETSRMMTNTENSRAVDALTNETGNDNVEYDLSRFTTIKSIGQYREYKMIAKQEYPEYKMLHELVVKAGERFWQLEEQITELLRSVGHNDRRVKEIEKQIEIEYLKKKNDAEHTRVRERFQYLHAKHAHISSLVKDFKKAHTVRSKVLLQPQ